MLYQHRKQKKLISYCKIWILEVIQTRSCIYRFDENCQRKNELSGQVKTNETEKWKVFSIKHEQGKVETTSNFKEGQGWLNILQNGTGIFEYRERVHGIYSINIPWKSLLAAKIICGELNEAKNRSVIWTAVAVRENFWIPELWQIAKKVITKYFGSKKL